MEEIWKDIYFIDSITGEEIDYRGMYQVSNLGNVKALERMVEFGRSYRIIKEHLLDQHLQGSCRYKRFSLSKDNKNRSFTVHRLVAHMFIPNPNNYPCVNHKSEVKTENSVENLEWCSYQYNALYGEALNTRVRHLKEGYADGSIQKRMKKPVLQCDLDGNVIKMWDSAKEASEAMGVEISSVSQVAREKPHHKTAAGFKWKYV